MVTEFTALTICRYQVKNAQGALVCTLSTCNSIVAEQSIAGQVPLSDTERPA